MTEFLTDGVHLYEVAARQSVRNYGLTGGTFRYAIVRDVVSEATARLDDLHLAALSPVPDASST